jgi:hypothetical protein
MGTLTSIIMSTVHGFYKRTQRRVPFLDRSWRRVRHLLDRVLDDADTLVLGRTTSERMDVTGTARRSRRHRTHRARRTR